MKRSLLLYVALVALAAAVLAGFILANYPVALTELRAWGGILALVVLTLLAEGLGVRMSAGRAVFSVALIPTVAIVPLFGPSVAVVSTACAHLVAQTIILKKHPVKAAFNVSQLTLAIGLGSVV
ncbi:MAG: hypothetical protein PVI01_09825, partial [Gemmatimonadales bacterium]